MSQEHSKKFLSGEDQADHDRIEKTSKGVLGYFVNRRRVVILVVALILLAGLFAAVSLPREANPEVIVPVAVVVTVWPGSSPADMESLITDKLEQELENLDKLKLITSSSRDSISTITVEFEADADLEDSIRKVRDEVQNVPGLPEGAEDPEVIEVRLDDQAIVTLSLVGDLTDAQLKRLGERVRDDLESISGVSRVELTGVRDREITVAVDPAELTRLGVSVSEVIGAIRQANLNLPLGSIENNGLNFNLRTIGELAKAQDLAEIVIKNTTRGAVLLSDVAVITDQLAEKKTLSRIALKGREPQNTVSLQMFKTAGGNIIEIVDQAKAKLDSLKQSGEIPGSVEVVVTNDQSEFVRKDFNTLSKSGLQTLMLIFLVIALALSLRFALIALLSIPLIFLMGLTVISLQGSTLNSLTLFSLVLSLGLLIDTTIIMLEGIFEALQRGYGARESALYSIAVYKWPIVAGVLTTIAAFVPMFLVGGIVGQFLVTLPLTISAVLGASLFIGLVIMPPLAAYFLQGASEQEAPGQNWFQQRVIDPLKNQYHGAIRKLLSQKKARRRMYIWLSALFIISLSLVGGGILKTQLFPEVDIDFILVNVELPKGTTLEVTAQKIQEVEQLIAQIPELENYVANIGSSSTFGFGDSGSSSENLANITINLVDANDRDLKSYEIANMWRTRLEAIVGAAITVEEIQGGPPTGAPIELQVLGEDFTTLSQVASEIKQKLSTIAGVINIESSDKPSPPEFAFHLDHQRLGQFNLSASQISTVLRTAVFGTKSSEVTIDDEDIDIVVKYGSGVSSIAEIKNLEVTNLLGQNIKISQVADISLEPALETIRHRDLARVISVTASNDQRTVREITTELNSQLETLELPVGVQLGQAGEFEEEAQAFMDLYKTMIVAVLLIFFIMVLQFDSYKQPFVILLTLPLAFIGVIFGTLIFGLPFGFSTFLGIVALGGIVVNDAIVLVSRINDNTRERRLGFNEAIAEAGEARLQPIILTTVTTILGVVPLAFADEFWRGLSIAIAFGMFFATFLTLFVVPVLFQRLERKHWNREHPASWIS